MIEHDGLFGKGARERNQIIKLRLKQPGIERQAKRAQMAEPGAKGVVAVKPLRRVEGRAQHVRIGIPGGCVANAAKPGRCGLQRLEHGPRGITGGQVGMPHDRGTRAVIAVKPAGALRRHAVDECNLAHRFERGIAIGVIERAAFHIDRADHVVPGGYFGMQFVKGVIGRQLDRRDERVIGLGKMRQQRPQIPQMMMRIDDRQIGFENWFRHGHSRGMALGLLHGGYG